MNVEIVEFYPLERNEVRGILTGTLRIKLPDIGLHILGIYVSKSKASWFFSLPGRHGIDHKTGKKIRYPFVGFEDREKQKELIAAVREKAPPFIEQRLSDTENPLIFPDLQKHQRTKAPQPSKPKEATPKLTEPAPAASTKPTVWMDPPQRKQPARNTGFAINKQSNKLGNNYERNRR